MAHYSPEMLAALRHAYENTDTPLPRLAAEFKIGITTLQRLRDKEGWARRSERRRELPREMQLLEAAKALAAAQVHPLPEENLSSPFPVSGDERTSSSVGSTANSDSSCAGLTRASIEQNQNPLADMDCRVKFTAGPAKGRTRLPGNDLGDGPPPTIAGADSALSPIERLEALVVKEIAAEEAVRDRLQGVPRLRGEAERCARTLSVLAQTLRSLQQQRRIRLTDDETTHDHDDMPTDIDEFRRDLARRIDAFVASRTDAADADGSLAPAPLDEA